MDDEQTDRRTDALTMAKTHEALHAFVRKSCVNMHNQLLFN